VQTWDGSTWTAQSPNLDQTSYTTFTQQLTTSEVTGGPQIRLMGQDTTPNTQNTIGLDNVRVVTS